MPKQLLDKNNNLLYSGYETDEIVANPQLDGTEANLTGLQVGETKYKVPQGGGGSVGNYYTISFRGEDEDVQSFTCTFSIYDTQDLTTISSGSELFTYLDNKFKDEYDSRIYVSIPAIVDGAVSMFTGCHNGNINFLGAEIQVSSITMLEIYKSN